jgi:PhnB protein
MAAKDQQATKEVTIMAAKPIPQGYRNVTPYLKIKGAADALAFYKKALGATERMCMNGPGGKVMHAEIEIGDSVLMLSDEFPDHGCRGPQSLGGTTVGIHLYVQDADAVFNRAVAGGAKVLRPVQDQFYGDRTGTVVDPFGHEWTISTHKEDVSPEELHKRMEEAMKQKGCG